jgi:phospholipid/cholesterol/gamma-HCH transport system substrate-binding protein
MKSFDNKMLSMPLMRARSRLFTLGAFVLLIAVLLTVLFKQNYFSQTTTLYFFTPNGQGLNVGMAVKFAGFKVGSVQNISIDSQAQVKVALSLSNDYVHLIGRDAKARLIKEGLIGESVVDIVSSETESRRVAQNDVLVFERALDIAELADKLVGQVQPILDDVKKITAAVSDADQDIRDSLRNMNQVSGELIKTTRQFTALADESHHTLAIVKHTVATLDVSMPKIVSGVEGNLSNLEAVSADVRHMTTPVSGSIPRIFNSSELLIRDGKEILGAAKSSWPINTMLPESRQNLLSPDAYVEQQLVPK